MILTVQANAAHLPLADESVHCCVCSPPYFGLRDYGLPPSVWGGEAGCAHEWKSTLVDARHGDDGIQGSTLQGGKTTQSQAQRSATEYSVCSRCGAWRGCLGLEPDLHMYVEHLVAVFREVKRVLRDDATCWVNLGDSFYGGKGANGNSKARRTADERGYKQSPGTVQMDTRPLDMPQKGLKPKDLVGIPWRVAFALQADGWYLRSDIIWAKGLSFCPEYAGSSMPESVKDRPSSSHEHVFLLSKSSWYFYDAEAAREPAACDKWPGIGPQHGTARQRGEVYQDMTANATRNLRNVWAINPAGYAGAHFATWPPALVEPMILAGTSERGCCPHCGAPWERVVEREAHVPSGAPTSSRETRMMHNRDAAFQPDPRTQAVPRDYVAKSSTLSWRPTCDCPEHEPVPCVVLDPFAGSGTTGMVAVEHRRRAVLCDLSGTYLRELATERTDGVEMRLPMPQMEG